ncbi:MAG: GEVED domain-containing protein [Bacteroidales bacterium]|nr:GEVED domain-containing protein [Bacteroidales bacterium]
MQAQIYEVFRQGFEVNETANYTVQSGTAAPQTSFYYGGSRAMKITHGNQAVIVLDEIDMSSYATLNYFTLEFAHINNVNPSNCASSEQVAMIEAKLASSNTWTRLTTTYYDRTGNYSDFYNGCGYFSNMAYPEWSTNGQMDASWWRNERFNLDRIFTNVNAGNRKLNIRITLYAKTGNFGVADQGWYLDDIVVRASAQPIVKPVIKMLQYPDLVNHPSSRGAKIVADVKAGNNSLSINPDSVYVLYKIGHSNTVHKQTMSQVPGVANRYTIRMPFEGYDTMMYFRIVAKDASNNQNTATQPASEAAWYEYRCVRGAANSGYVSMNGNVPNAPYTLTFYPFPTEAIGKAEFVLDSALLHNAGFEAGSITGLSFLIKSGLQTAPQTREDVSIRMKNAYSTYTTSPILEFSNDYTQTVYRGNINFPITVNNNPFSLTLQDTFFYAGKDLIVQIIQNNSNDMPSAIGLAGISTLPSKATLYNADVSFMEYDPYTYTEYNNAYQSEQKMPNFAFNMDQNPPLINDCGIAEVVFPSSASAATANTNQQVQVTLKNFGVNTLNGIRIAYQLDNNNPVYYNWTGSLASNATQTVTLTSTQQFTPGYHTITAWVEDTMTSGSNRYRDHEPYNDTAFCEFIACAGPMTGVRQIGGANADFGSMHEFLFSLSSCGISGGLTVKLAPGTYEPFEIPAFSGASATSYLTFEPLNSGAVVFLADSAVTTHIADLQNATYTRFRNVTFRSINEAPLTYMARLGSSSNYCKFEGCTFDDVNGGTQALIYSGNCNNLTVDGCTFNGGVSGVDLSGMSINQRSSGNKVSRSQFAGQRSYGVYVYNQNNAEVDSNYFNNILSNAGYAVLLQNAYGTTKVTRNKVYTSHGAAAIGAATVTGSATGYAIIANNMIVEEDDGTAISIVSPLNIQSASYTKIVYNSVKFTADSRSDIAAASFGGVSIDNSIFKNNIIATLDNYNYALNYTPGSNTTNQVGSNIYYTRGAALNRLGSNTYNNINAWRTAVPSDNLSQKVNPSFLNGERVDLRTFNQAVKNIAVPIAGVTDDMFGTVRPTTPCVGAFEFDALYYDFEIVDLVEPFDSYCGGTNAIPLRLKMYNWGTTTFTPSASNPLKIVYQYGSVTDSVSVSTAITSGDTTLVNTTATLNMPSYATSDREYALKLWISCSSDPNNTNDTARYTVRSNYVSPAPSPVAVTSPYQQPATINVNTGINTWPVNVYNVGPTMPSTLYWYASATSDSILHRGTPFVSDSLMRDTVFYFRQHRELPIIRISEVAFDNNYTSATSTVVGSTSPRPVWLNTGTKYAVELTNVGDYPADLYNDTIAMYSSNSGFNNKIFKVPTHVMIQPGASVVLQFFTPLTTTDSTVTIPATPKITNAPSTQPVAVVYRHAGAICDAVPIRIRKLISGVDSILDMTTTTQWNNLNVPNYIWSGPGLLVESVNAGISRIGWPQNPAATPANTAQYWRAATNQYPLTLGTTNPDLILYHTNDCEGPRATATVTLSGVPNIDLAVETDPIQGGCGLGDETVSCTLSNYGIQNCPVAYVSYSVNGVLVQTDTVNNLAAGASVHHTFSTPVNMHAATDQTFVIKTFVVRNTTELASTLINDTSAISVQSLRTPDAPVASSATTNYAQSATLSAVSSNTSDGFVWYSRYGVALDTTTSNTFVTPILYADDTFYVSAVNVNSNESVLGTGTAQSANTDKICPFASNNRFYKSQFIYTAAELQAAGVQPGNITSLSFEMTANTATAANTPTFASYTISMGATNNEIFSANNAWETVNNEVFSSSSVTFPSSAIGWYTFQLQTPYLWDGTSNIVIQICREMSSALAQTVKGRYTSKTNSCLGLTNDASAVCSATGNGTRSANRPNMKVGSAIFGCAGPTCLVPVTVVGAPDYDAAVVWNGSFNGNGTGYSSCGPISLPIRVRNQGSVDMDNYSVVMRVDGDSVATYHNTASIVAGDSAAINLPAYSFTPGRHVVSAQVVLSGDTITNNDEVSTILPVRFCGGSYNVGPGTNFVSISAATDTLNEVGMDGSVVFNIVSGTYDGQATFGSFNGADSSRTVTFQSLSGNADDVVLTAAPTTDANYVINIDGSQYLTLKNLTIYGKHTTGSGNNIYATAVQLANCSNVNFDSVVVRVKSTSSLSNNANGIVIYDGVENVNITNSLIDSGYFAITTKATTEDLSGAINIHNNQIHGFFNRGINLRNLHDVSIVGNRIESATAAANRPLYGVYIAGHTGLFELVQNHIYLSDDFSGGRRGITLNNVLGTQARRAKVYDNMVSCYSSGMAGLNPSCGLLIDSASTYINVYFNTFRVYAGINQGASRAVSIGNTIDNITNINVRDNIMANFSQGYAYYVKSTAAIPSNGSNYNVYYSNATNPKLAFYGLEMTTLADLQAANNQDDHSIVQQPYFLNDMNDLHVASGQFSDCGEYLAQVPQDIDGNTRPQIPNPTIGAHEYGRQQYDLSIIEVIEPYLPRTTNPHPTIEGKTMRVIVKIFNNGLNNVNGASWSADLVGTTNNTGVRPIPTMTPRQYWTDTAFIQTQLGLVDTHFVHVHLDTPSSIADANLDDNDTLVKIFLDPAYDLQVTSVAATGGCAPLNSNSTVTITIKNVGLDTIPVTMPLTFGFSAYTSYNQNTGVGTRTISTFPQNVTETQYLTAFLPPQTSRPIILNTHANLYPTGKDTNMTAVKVRGWVHCQYDLYPTGNGHQDTAISGNINSFYTPQAPVGVDNHIPYATWDTVWASQRNSRPIEWYRDSTNLNSRFNVKNQYAASTHWDNGPQYFHDSTYYLRTTTDKGCISPFSTVTVYLNPLVNKDAAVEQVLNPRPTGTVFAEDDTVKVRLVNYGSQTISNIPVTYQLLNGAGTQVFQQVTETCSASIASGQTYDFNFDSLLQIPAPNTPTAYKIRVWTDLPGEQVRLNDTIRFIYTTTYQGLNGTYPTISVGTDGLDITRVSFNSLHNEMFPLGYGYNNFGAYGTPEIPVLHLTRGTHDTLFVQCENRIGSDSRSGSSAKLGVWIDYNRDGRFSLDETNEEWIASTTIMAEDTIPLAIPVTIPEDAWFGHMRMRIFLCGDDCNSINPGGKVNVVSGTPTVSSNIDNGDVHDYMLYIDPEPPAYDVAINHIVGTRGKQGFFDTISRFSPILRNRIEDGPQTIYFNVANKGASALTNIDINYSFNGPNDTTSGVINWTGNLMPGYSTMVAVPTYSFDEGTTELQLSIDQTGDRDPSNNTFSFEFHRFHVVVLKHEDDFEGVSMWYAPKGYSQYTRNVWQLGTPAKNTIVGTASGDNAWCTDLDHTIVTGKYGNYSILYSPIIDISSVRADTLAMYLNRAMPAGSKLVLQFLNFDRPVHKWVDLFGIDTVTTWYNEEGCFSGSSNGRYVDQILSLRSVSGDFPQDLQFRFIYCTNPGANDNTSYGDGCAIDDIRIGRAQRAEDVGIVDIIEPTEPRYGETIYPKVVIKNYGYATRNRVEVGYIPHGSNLSKTGVWTGTLEPGDTVHYRFERGFVITSDFPDTFAITAFSFLGTDIYYDNDSNTRIFTLAPLSHDLNVQQIISPTPRVVAGDSLDITVKIRNFGTDPMDNISLSYVFNGAAPVTEQVDFTQYVGPDGLPSMEYFNYTFKHRVRASLGYMTLQVYGNYDRDVYPYNDTVSRALEGITSIKDIAAVGVIVDVTNKDNLDRVYLVIQNQGARSANDFEVGFYVDGDTTTTYRTTYHTEMPLASLAQTTFLFDSLLPRRNEPRDIACGFVNLIGDNNSANDTTNILLEPQVDIKLHRIEIEENRSEECRVRLVVENIGNAVLTKTQTLSGTINGVELAKTDSERSLIPGNIYYLPINGTVPKVATRDYQGRCKIYQASDVDHDNDESTIVRVLNYFEDIVDADESDGIVLHQNVPNPYSHATSIDFEIPAPGDVTFYVLDLMGRMVYSQTAPYSMGTNTIHYNSDQLSSGTYFYGIIFDGKRVMRKMVVK